MWDEVTGNYLDPGTGEVLPSWDQAVDAIGADDEPWHVARFGDWILCELRNTLTERIAAYQPAAADLDGAQLIGVNEAVHRPAAHTQPLRVCAVSPCKI